MLFDMKQPKQLNKNLHKAKRNKNDEFYTQIADIERELRHYTKHFKNKVVFCNCDDPDWSAFTKYFALNFDRLKLKKVISTHYEEGKSSYKLEITRQLKNTEEISSLPRVPLEGDGDFRSEECIEILREADIVVTNPPFSLFREYIALLIAHEKKFLIIGNINAISYMEVFPLIRSNELWLGQNCIRHFITPAGELYETARTYWYTNLHHSKRDEEFVLVKRYKGNEENYPIYDSYNAIEVSYAVNIPMDYSGVMGVPITFLDKYNPKQFEIVSSNDHRRHEGVPFKEHGLIKDKDSAINGKPKYVRILIRRRQK